MVTINLFVFVQQKCHFCFMILAPAKADVTTCPMSTIRRSNLGERPNLYLMILLSVASEGVYCHARRLHPTPRTNMVGREN